MQTESSKNEMIKEEEEKERNASASIATVELVFHLFYIIISPQSDSNHTVNSTEIFPSFIVNYTLTLLHFIIISNKYIKVIYTTRV